MPQALRTQMALVLLLGVFLIPIGMSSLRGLTHVLTCDQTNAQNFSIDRGDDSSGDAQVGTDIGANTIERNENPDVCGLQVSIGVVEKGQDRELRLDITNPTDNDWRGTIELQVDDLLIPINIGEVKAGEKETKTIPLNIDARQLTGKLLIGP